MHVKLLTRPGCHLCEDVKAELAALATDYPHTLEEINIADSIHLFEKYHLTIPVVQVGDVELQAPITKQQLIDALRQ